MDNKNFLKSNITIRQASAKDENAWRKMWEAYNNFYGASVPENITVSVWKRILDKSNSINAIVAENQDGLVGFVNYVLHEYTWSQGLACLMDDLFVESKARGNGVGTLLIQALIEMAKENNWTRLYWMTREGNEKARSLYDKFSQADGFVRYKISLDNINPKAGDS